MRYAKRVALMGSVALGTALWGSTAKAESWGEPSPEFARYGIRTIVCDERTHDSPCLGLACRDGALALVNASGGGGPMDGPARLSTGRQSFTLKFRYDEKAVDKLGNAASEVDLTIRQYEALLEAKSITLTAQSDRRWRHRFPTRGLAGEWEKAAQECK